MEDINRMECPVHHASIQWRFQQEPLNGLEYVMTRRLQASLSMCHSQLL